jgi:NTP pyrophosphatase (non-canonical NTP hydrolase)
LLIERERLQVQTNSQAKDAQENLEELLTGETLEIRELQAFHVMLDREKAFDLDLFRNIAYLVGELGEVVRAARQFQRAEGTLDQAETRDHLGEELADCLAYLLKLANYAGIDLQAAYVGKMRRNVTRTWPQRPHERA